MQRLNSPLIIFASVPYELAVHHLHRRSIGSPLRPE
jgi:hypothetical protein